MKYLIQLLVAILLSIIGYLELASGFSEFLTGLGVGLFIGVLITLTSNYYQTKTS